MKSSIGTTTELVTTTRTVPTINLELSIFEALVLLELSQNIGGLPSTSVRHIFSTGDESLLSQIHGAMKSNFKFNYTQFCNDVNALQFGIPVSIMCKDINVDLLKQNIDNIAAKFQISENKEVIHR